MDLSPESAVVTGWSMRKLSMLTPLRKIFRNCSLKLNSSRKNSLMSIIASHDKCLKWEKYKIKKGKNLMKFKSITKIKKLTSKRNSINKTSSATNSKPKLSHSSNSKTTAWVKWANLTKNVSKSIKLSTTSTKKYKK